MMQQYRSNSYLFGGNAPYVEELYEAAKRVLDSPVKRFCRSIDESRRKIDQERLECPIIRSVGVRAFR